MILPKKSMLGVPTYFKLDLTIRELQLDQDLIAIEIGGKRKIKIILRKPTEEEQSIGHSDLNPFCEVSGEWVPKENMLAMFKMLEENKLPKGSKNQDEWSIYDIDKDGNFKGRLYVPLRILPDPFAAYIRQIDGELNDFAKRTVNLLRWRCGTHGYHNPISWRGASWSLDGENWYPTPGSMQAHMSTVPYVRTSDEVLEDVRGYIIENKNHPLGYELFLEAWPQRLQNPRSSLIVGIAAAETAGKCPTK